MKKGNDKGITLVALVITIIVLLILAGVALSLVAGNEGILTKAETAVTKTRESSAKEQAELMFAEFVAEFYEKKYVTKDSSIADKKLGGYIEEKFGTDGLESPNGDYTVKLSDGTIEVFEGEATDAFVSGSYDDNAKVTWD